MRRSTTCLLLALLTLAGAAQATDWTQLQADAARSGYSPDAVRGPFELKWSWFGDYTQGPGDAPPEQATVRLSDMIQPIVADGKVFVGAMDGKLYAIDRETGRTVWSFPTGRPIVNTAAYVDGIVVVNSMDGCTYGVNAADGSQAWKHETPYGLLSAPAVQDGVAYITGRDGKAYALDVRTGDERWAYDAGAPIVNSPAVHEGVVLFGSEDMYAHGVDAATGERLWRRKLPGQSFRSTWPVAYGDMAIFHSMPAISGSEMQVLWDPEMEAVLDAAPENDWPAERDLILEYLTNNPGRQTVFVLDLKTGETKYVPPIGYVAGNMQPPVPAVYDDQGRIYIYWRTRSSRLQGFGTYGTKWVPDISWMDPETGDRVRFPWPRPQNYFAVELDNNFQLTLGGDVLYGSNQFRVMLYMDLKDGEVWGITKAFQDERDGGYPVPPRTFSHYAVRGQQPRAPGSGTNGESGIVPSGDCVFINETAASCVSCFQGQASGQESAE